MLLRREGTRLPQISEHRPLGGPVDEHPASATCPARAQPAAKTHCCPLPSGCWTYRPLTALAPPLTLKPLLLPVTHSGFNFLVFRQNQTIAVPLMSESREHRCEPATLNCREIIPPCQLIP